MEYKYSIIISVLNGEDFIERSLLSCLNQTYENIEIVIVNDGCTDSTMDIVSRFNDPRIRVITNKENIGILHSRCKGIQSATGDRILFLDADDYLYPDACEKLQRVQDEKDMILYLIRFEHSEKTYPGYPGKSKLAPSLPEYYLNTYSFPWSPMYKCCTKNLALKAVKDLQFIEEKVCLAEDYILHCALSVNAKTYAILDEVLYWYHISNGDKKDYMDKDLPIIKKWPTLCHIYDLSYQLYISKIKELGEKNISTRCLRLGLLIYLRAHFKLYAENTCYPKFWYFFNYNAKIVKDFGVGVLLKKTIKKL